MDYESYQNSTYKQLKSALTNSPHLHQGKGSIEIYKSLSHCFAHLIHTRPFLNKIGQQILYSGPMTQSTKKFLVNLETHLYKTRPLTGEGLSVDPKEIKAAILFADHYLTAEAYQVTDLIEELHKNNIPTLLISFQMEMSETIFPTSYLSIATVISEDFVILQSHTTNANFPQSSEFMSWNVEAAQEAVDRIFSPIEEDLKNAIRVFESSLPKTYSKYFKDNSNRYLDRSVIYSPYIDGSFMQQLLSQAFPKIEIEKHCIQFSLSDTQNSHNRAQITGLEQAELRGLLCLSGQLILESNFQAKFKELAEMALERQGMNHADPACILDGL